MSRLGSIMVYGLKSMQQPKQKRKPITARSILGDLICDTWQYYTQPKMSEEERTQFREWMNAPPPEPVRPLTTAERLARLERISMGRSMPYTTVSKGRRAK